jgi:MFS family permease
MFACASMNMGQTALADLYKDEPVEMARWTSLFQMGRSVASIFGPLISGILAVRDLRYSYIASAIACVVNLVLCSFIQETLPVRTYIIDPPCGHVSSTF